ncbi:hypothetical protein BCR36DRAFT_412114 [Piromyces finnis]|uniref:Uncharacterized protein n=1 Tax=Piromyces finnis TaxID=1754191 RepID=A0A1Y1VAG6_9FUNG|nr:hypothetical protein BCR36DRAFT_412114 [Piromyces finnis]|eukprot:ORX51157.1 hypothetical protein BCR36DRAFT_412114 [Piromyces finnis]
MYDNKSNTIREKIRIVGAIHSLDKKIEFLEKDIINTIGLNHPHQHLSSSKQPSNTIASLIHQYQKQKLNKNQSIEFLFNLPIETEDNFELFDRVECNKKLDHEKKNLSMKLSKIKQNVNTFKDQVNKKENSIKYLDNLKSLMEEIESNIVLFKENQKNIYEELLITEKRLHQELSIFQEHLNDWNEKKALTKEGFTRKNLFKQKNHQNSSTFTFSSTPLPNTNLTLVPSEVTMEAKLIIQYGYKEGKKKFISSTSSTSFHPDLDKEEDEEGGVDQENEAKKYLKSEQLSLEMDDQQNHTMKNPEDSENHQKNSSLKSTYLYDVERFRSFYVRNHGRNGGWDELSHSMFEKIWKKIGPSNSRFEQMCLDSIPGLDKNRLEKHIQWYKTYHELEQKKKEALENWRLENKKKRIENQQALNINPSHIELELKNKMNNEKKKKEEEQRQKIKQKLKLWKEKKKLEEEKEILMANKEKQKEKELEAKKLQIKQKLNKEKLKLYEAKKKNGSSISSKINNVMNTVKEKKKMDLKYFQEKDKKYLNKILQRQMKNQKEKSDKELRLKKIKSVNIITVEKDPNRIFQPTKTFQNYVNSINNNNNNTNKSRGLFTNIEHVNEFFHSNELPHRAIPIWRKGIS